MLVLHSQNLQGYLQTLNHIHLQFLLIQQKVIQVNMDFLKLMMRLLHILESEQLHLQVVFVDSVELMP